MLPTLTRTRALSKFAVIAAAVSMVLVSLIGTTQAQGAVTKPDREVDSGWDWTNYGPELKSVSCSTPNTCAAVGQGGAVLRSPNTDDVPLAWTFVDLKKDPQHPDNPIDLVGVTCSTSSCLAVSSPLTPTISYGSWVYRSTDAGVTWTAVQQLPPVGTRNTMIGSAITCAPDPNATAGNRVCLIAGTAGGIWRSADDGRTWSGVPLPSTALPITSFNKVACVSPSACVVAGGSNTPSSAFVNGTTVTVLDTPTGIDQMFAALACDGGNQCVATGGQGGYTVMTVDSTPTWGTVRAFRKSPLPAVAKVVSVACPATNVCVGIDGSGMLLRTDTLNDPNGYWRQKPVQIIIGTLTCVPNTGNCIGVGKKAAWYASFDAGSSFGRVNEIAGFDVAVCGGTLGAACIAGGKENVGRSITGGTLWNLPIADRGALNTMAIECQSSLSCEIFGMTDTLVTNDMDVFRTRYGPVQSAAGADAITCVNDSLCVSPSKASAVYTTFDGGVTTWSSNQMPLVRPTSITCLDGKTNPVTCLVPVKYNILLGTMTRDASTGLPHWSWKYTNADSDQIIAAIDCTPDGSQCVAAGEQGQILTTQANNLMEWTPQVLPIRPTVAELPSYSSVSCPANGFCMVGGKHGPQSVVMSTVDFFSTYSYDEIGDIRDAPGITSFGCESINRCVGVGMTVLLGLRTPPITK